MKSYARAVRDALLSQVSQGSSQVEVQEKIDFFTELLRDFQEAFWLSKDLRTLLASPGVSRLEKQNVLSALVSKLLDNQKAQFPNKANLNAQLTLVVSKLLMLLAERGHLRKINTLTSALQEIKVELCGAMLASVEVAEELESRDKEHWARVFKDLIAKKIGKPVELSWRRNPELLAGFRVRVDGKTFDGSLAGQVDRMARGLVDSVVTD